MSLGSGVNYQLYGKNEKGVFNRKAVSDVALTAGGDGYFLEGTCLGGGFLMGVGRLATQEKDYAVLLNRLKETDLKEYYDAIVINLF